MDTVGEFGVERGTLSLSERLSPSEGVGNLSQTQLALDLSKKYEDALVEHQCGNGLHMSLVQTLHVLLVPC
jgi:hypothetical protein